MKERSTPKTADVGAGIESCHEKLRGELYAGPVPHPDVLRKLDAILPGAAARIFQMAEKDQDQVIAMQRGALELKFQNLHFSHSETVLAQWLAFVICLLFLACGSWLVSEGHDWAGGIMLGGTVASIVASFLYGNSRRKK